MEITFDFLIRTFFTITSINVVTHGVAHVKPTDEVNKCCLGQYFGLPVCLGQSLHVCVHANDHLQVVGRGWKQGQEVLFHGLLEQVCGFLAAVQAVLD